MTHNQEMCFFSNMLFLAVSRPCCIYVSRHNRRITLNSNHSQLFNEHNVKFTTTHSGSALSTYARMKISENWLPASTKDHTQIDLGSFTQMRTDSIGKELYFTIYIDGFKMDGRTEAYMGVTVT